MPDIRYVYVVSDLSENDDALPILVTFDEDVASDLSVRLGGRVDRVILIGGESDE